MRSDLKRTALRLLENPTSGYCVVFCEHIELFADLPIKYRLISVSHVMRQLKTDPKICNLEYARLVEKEVSRFYVCMYNTWMVLFQICKLQ